jgi:ADP-ribose pyrophosphatase
LLVVSGVDDCTDTVVAHLAGVTLVATDDAGAQEPRPWRRIESREIYANPWISVREDQVERPDGSRGIYGVVTTGECVGVLPLLDGRRVLLVRQWRYVAGRATWEMPTGGVQAGESLEGAAQRELAEEAGWRARRLERLTSYSTSKSVLDETAHLYVGMDLVPAVGEPDEPEFLDVAEFDFDDVVAMVERGEIVDSMTIIAMLLADRRGPDRRARH